MLIRLPKGSTVQYIAQRRLRPRAISARMPPPFWKHDIHACILKHGVADHVAQQDILQYGRGAGWCRSAPWLLPRQAAARSSAIGSAKPAIKSLMSGSGLM